MGLFKRWLITQLKDLKYSHYSPNKRNVYAMFFDGHCVQGRGVEFLFKTLLNKRTRVDDCLKELR